MLKCNISLVQWIPTHLYKKTSQITQTECCARFWSQIIIKIYFRDKSWSKPHTAYDSGHFNLWSLLCLYFVFKIAHGTQFLVILSYEVYYSCTLCSKSNTAHGFWSPILYLCNILIICIKNHTQHAVLVIFVPKVYFVLIIVTSKRCWLWFNF